MNTRIVVCIGVLVQSIALGSVVKAQDQDSIAEIYSRCAIHELQEKVYVHTDRDDYLAGERVWMKFYCVDAAHHQLSDMSKVGYVEILNAQNQPVCQTKLRLVDGSGSGNFWLPATLPTGMYTLRAYTNWMKNMGAELLFDKPLRIINTMQDAQEPVSSSSAGSSYDVQFFPEGGSLVADLESTVGFRAVDRYGRGVDASGFVLSSQGDTVARFQTEKFGLGRFQFTPLPNLEYMAVVKVSDGQTLHLEMPVARPEGYVLSLSESTDGRISIDVTSTFVLTQLPVAILAHDRSDVVFSQSAVMTNGKAHFEIDKALLKPGITHFTLFDNTGRPRCERLYSRGGEFDRLPVAMTTDQTEYGVREPITMDLKADSATLSLAVYRVDGEDVPESADMLSYLELESEIGPVESPSYYFGPENATLRRDRDNLMLTHGWRRFDWDDILGGDLDNRVNYLPEYEGHLISGRISGKLPADQLGDVPVYLSVPGASLNLYATRTHKDGTFQFNVLNFWNGTSQLVVEPEVSVDSSLRVSLDTPYFDQYVSRTYMPYVPDSSSLAALTDRSIYMQMYNLSTPRIEAAIPEEGRYAQLYAPNSRYMLDEYTRFPLMDEVYTEFITTARFREVDGRPQLFVIAAEKDGPHSYPALAVLDGVRITDHRKIYDYDPLKVNKIENFQPVYVKGNDAIYGITSLSTRDYNMPGFHFDPQVLMAEYESLQSSVEFVSPQYASPEAKASRMPDVRYTMYWDPNIQTGPASDTRISWYTSDLPGEYRVVLQGISTDGRPICQTMGFSVKE